MKKLMILGASILQLPAIKKAKEMGLYTIAVDMDKDAIGFKYSDKNYQVSTVDIDGVLEVVKKEKPDGIMTLATDKPVYTIAKVSEYMGYNIMSVDTAIRVTNKAKMRQALKDKNVPIPEFYVVSDYKEYIRATKNFEERFIVKPVDSSGSRGIYLINDKNDKNDVEKAFLHSKQFSSTGEVLVEEFMTGPEVSVETLTVNGQTIIIAITDKVTSGAPFFVEKGHAMPSQLNEDVKVQISNVAIKAIDALGIIEGPSHTEIKVTESGPKIVEVGARLGGDNITTELVPLSTGIDMVEKCIEISLKRKVSIPQPADRAAAIRYFDSSSGILTKVEGIDKAKEVIGVEKVFLYKEVNEKINDIESSGDRVGSIIATAKTTEQAIDICNSAYKNIKLEIEK